MVISEFSAEIERAKQAGVTHPENLPFLLTPSSPNGKALLLIHGFGASPNEMRALGEFLCGCGFLTLGTRLAGHGTSPEDLRNCRWQDWFESVERDYTCLRNSGHPVSVVAQSTGALLGLFLAHQREIERLILLSPFLKLDHPLARFAGILKYLVPFQRRKLPYPDHLHYYERRPLSGIEQIGRLRDQIEPIIPHLQVPTLVMAAEGDQTVARGTGRILFEKLGSPHKKFHLFGPEVPHVLSSTENPKFDRTCHLCKEFLGENDRPAG